MANPHFAQLVHVDRFPKGAALLRLEMEEPTSLSFLPGQYVIVNSGLTLANGKLAKRAYSLFGGSEDGRSFHLAAERLEGGAVSTYLNSLEEGSRLQFSGPWGKFLPPALGWGGGERIVGVAFGTGITALLGLFADPQLAAAELIWIRDPAAAFLPDSCIKDLLPRRVQSLAIAERPASDPVEGAALSAIRVLESSLSQGADLRVYTAGEGGAIDQLDVWLREQGLSAEKIHKESFFRFPESET